MNLLQIFVIYLDVLIAQIYWVDLAEKLINLFAIFDTLEKVIHSIDL